MTDYDITALILTEHDGFRRQFAQLRDSADPDELTAHWNDLADRLEVHASGEEAVFYPRLLRQVPAEKDDTVHAVHDHNKIRTAVQEVARHEVGSEAWWQAVAAAQEENSEHMEEEEHDMLATFRDEAAPALREEIGLAWLQFLHMRLSAVGLSAHRLAHAAGGGRYSWPAGEVGRRACLEPRTACG